METTTTTTDAIARAGRALRTFGRDVAEFARVMAMTSATFGVIFGGIALALATFATWAFGGASLAESIVVGVTWGVYIGGAFSAFAVAASVAGALALNAVLFAADGARALARALALATLAATR